MRNVKSWDADDGADEETRRLRFAVHAMGDFLQARFHRWSTEKTTMAEMQDNARAMIVLCNAELVLKGERTPEQADRAITEHVVVERCPVFGPMRGGG